MGKFILAMNVSVDGYVDDLAGTLIMGPPSAAHFRYWIETIRGHAGAIYGRRMYELCIIGTRMPEWDAPQGSLLRSGGGCRNGCGVQHLVRGRPQCHADPRGCRSPAAADRGERPTASSASRVRNSPALPPGGVDRRIPPAFAACCAGWRKALLSASTPPLRLVSSTSIDDDTLHLIYAPRQD